jgi:NADH dehydrogenase
VVVAVDLRRWCVRLRREAERAPLELTYDFLVVALGSSTDLSRLPGVAEHALEARTIGDAFHLRNHVIDVLELAAVEDDPVERERLLTFVVAGSGFAGVELCSELNGLVRDALRFYPGIHPTAVHVALVTSASRLLPALAPDLGEKALRHLHSAHVDVRLGVGLASASPTAAILSNGEHIPTRTLVAAVGMGTNPVVASLPGPLRNGRIACDRHGRVPGWRGVYAAGDAASIPRPPDGAPAPATVTSARAQGRLAAENILAEVRGGRLTCLDSSQRTLALLSRDFGLMQWGRLHLAGSLPALLWRLSFLHAIPSWRRRLTVLFDWLVSAAFPRDITQLRISRTNAILAMRFAAGDTLVQQGDRARRFYIVSRGRLEVSQMTAEGTRTTLRELGPGDYFGEIALMRDVTRTASVRALSDAEVLSIAHEDFSVLVRHVPALRESLSRNAYPDISRS